MSPPPEHRWAKLWTANPAYRESLPIGWALDSGAEIAGFIGNLPRLMWDGQHEIIARVPTSWAVEPRARAFSLPLLVSWLNQPGADLLLNTTATPEAASIFDRLRVPRIPCRSLGERSIWILSYSGWISGLMRRWNLGAFSFLGALAAPIDQVRRVFDSSAGDRGLEWRAEFGPEFDALWKRLASRPVLQSVRDAANLQWAYGDSLNEKRAWLLAGADRDGLRGYAVFARYDIPTMGLVRMKLVDFAGLDDEPGPYVAAAVARCRREGVHVLETTGFEGPVYGALSRLRPIRMRIAGWPGYWRTKGASLARRLEVASNWYPSLYDGDSGLW